MSHRTFKIAALAVSFSFAFVSAVSASASESGPGNGTSYVKILFADAQFELARQLSPVGEEAIPQLSIDPVYKAWLLADAAGGGSPGMSKLNRLKYFERSMELRFQTEPCTDFTKKTASICFFTDPVPYVMVSLQENAMTTREQAMAMLIHEAGHFVGETDHLFLDRLGVQLVQTLRAPRLLIADVESLELAANPFTEKDACSDGTSRQASRLKQEALVAMRQQCSNRQITCDVSKAQLIFRGEAHWVDGVGFDMKVRCQVRAVLEVLQ